MPISDITAGEQIAKPLVQPASAYDEASWRVEDTSIPPMFRKTVGLRATPNKMGTNITTQLSTKAPVVTKDTNGEFSSKNLVSFETKGTALQNTVGSEVLDALDLHIAALQATRKSMATGVTTDM